jgi:xanthine dehydrogenase accessory factor
VADDLLGVAAELRRRGEPFALATVVRCERPVSARPGARAVVAADGSLRGWVGGACAEPVVVREALAALADGQPRLVSLTGATGHGPGRAEGVVEYPMTCHSGGTMEIYVEPFPPRPSLVVIGHGPVVETLATLARAVDLDVVTLDESAAGAALPALTFGPRSSVVVATHGHGDEDALALVLSRDAGYVSLVASRKRAAAVVERLGGRGVPAERLSTLRAPAGLDIGAVTPEEIAISILAEIVQVQRGLKPHTVVDGAASEAAADIAIDPICGMRVDIGTARYRSEAGGRVVYFCCAACQDAFARAEA